MDNGSYHNHGGRGDAETRRATTDSPRIDALIEAVIGACIEVHRALGPGFQEMTYHRALIVELELCGIAYETEVPVTLTYKDQPIGEGRIDLLIDNCLVVELKAADGNPRIYSRQVASYLKAADLNIGLVINFHVPVLKEGIARVINH